MPNSSISSLIVIDHGSETTRQLTAQSALISLSHTDGFGVGFGMQQPLIAAQTVCALADVPTATAIVNFTLTLGGALFISVAQNVFTNRLLTNLASNVPSINPSIILETGALSLRENVSPEDIGGVLIAYNDALTHAFYVSVAMASLSIIGAVGMEWKSVKGKKLEVVGA